MSARSPIEEPPGAGASPTPARLAAVLGVVATALLFRPYLGLFGDARIYVGHALAELDPAGVGRDLMFVYDRQSGFSLFPGALTKSVALLGPAAGAMMVAVLALAVWTASAAGALGAWVGRRTALVSLLCVLILPSSYGGFRIDIGEAAPLPRPFAEAFVLLGLWAVLRGRLWTAAAMMAAAAAVHPIMALPGVGVLVVLLCLEDRRWWLALGAGAVASLTGAALGLPVLSRLLVGMDARWLAVLHNCSPYLFLTAWPPDVWSQIVARAATLGLAAALLEGRARRVAVAALVVTGVALAASAALGDGVFSVLVLQMQPWRGLWLLSFLACAAAPVAALRLWRRGAASRLVLGLLACGWIATPFALLSVGASAAALVLFIAGRSGFEPSRPVRLAAWAVVGLGWTLALTGETIWMLHRTWGVPEPLRQPLGSDLLQDVFRVAAGAAVIAAAALFPQRRPAVWTGLVVFLLPLALFAAADWRALDAGRRLLVAGEAADEVRAITASRRGAVEWLGGDVEPVLLAGRPGWWTEVQAASSVFSREQAMIWAARRARLVATGAGPPELLHRFPHPKPARFWTPTPVALHTFCAFPDAPAWVVTPLRTGSPPPAGATLWRAPVAAPRAVGPGGPAAVVAAYAFTPCGGAAEAPT